MHVERRRRLWRAGGRADRPPGRPVDAMPGDGRLFVVRVTRALGALALLVVGGVHFEQYTVAHFSVIPTIGPLFLVNFIAATGFGLILLVPLGRGREADPARVRLAGSALAGDRPFTRAHSPPCWSASTPRCSASWSTATGSRS